MIVIKATDEQKIVAELSRLFPEGEVDIIQTDEEEFTQEDVMASMAYNMSKIRQYIGRIERNTKQSREEARTLNKLMEPLSTYMSVLVEGTDLGVVGAEQVARIRRNRVAQMFTEGEIRPKEKDVVREG